PPPRPPPPRPRWAIAVSSRTPTTNSTASTSQIFLNIPGDLNERKCDLDELMFRCGRPARRGLRWSRFRARRQRFADHDDVLDIPSDLASDDAVGGAGLDGILVDQADDLGRRGWPAVSGAAMGLDNPLVVCRASPGTFTATAIGVEDPGLDLFR